MIRDQFQPYRGGDLAIRHDAGRLKAIYFALAIKVPALRMYDIAPLFTWDIVLFLDETHGACGFAAVLTDKLGVASISVRRILKGLDPQRVEEFIRDGRSPIYALLPDCPEWRDVLVSMLRAKFPASRAPLAQGQPA